METNLSRPQQTMRSNFSPNFGSFQNQNESSPLTEILGHQQAGMLRQMGKPLETTQPKDLPGNKRARSNSNSLSEKCSSASSNDTREQHPVKRCKPNEATNISEILPESTIDFNTTSLDNFSLDNITTDLFASDIENIDFPNGNFSSVDCPKQTVTCPGNTICNPDSAISNTSNQDSGVGSVPPVTQPPTPGTTRNTSNSSPPLPKLEKLENNPNLQKKEQVEQIKQEPGQNPNQKLDQMQKLDRLNNIAGLVCGGPPQQAQHQQPAQPQNQMPPRQAIPTPRQYAPPPVQLQQQVNPNAMQVSPMQASPGHMMPGQPSPGQMMGPVSPAQMHQWRAQYAGHPYYQGAGYPGHPMYAQMMGGYMYGPNGSYPAMHPNDPRYVQHVNEMRKRQYYMHQQRQMHMHMQMRQRMQQEQAAQHQQRALQNGPPMQAQPQQALPANGSNPNSPVPSGNCLSPSTPQHEQMHFAGKMGYRPGMQGAPTSPMHGAPIQSPGGMPNVPSPHQQQSQIPMHQMNGHPQGQQGPPPPQQHHPSQNHQQALPQQGHPQGKPPMQGHPQQIAQGNPPNHPLQPPSHPSMQHRPPMHQPGQIQRQMSNNPHLQRMPSPNMVERQYAQTHPALQQSLQQRPIKSEPQQAGTPPMMQNTDAQNRSRPPSVGYPHPIDQTMPMRSPSHNKVQVQTRPGSALGREVQYNDAQPTQSPSSSTISWGKPQH